jgi:hypothetical protein
VHQAKELADVKAMLGSLLSTHPGGRNHLIATKSALTPADKLNPVEAPSCAVAASLSQQNERTQGVAEDHTTEQMKLSSAGTFHTFSHDSSSVQPCRCLACLSDIV